MPIISVIVPVYKVEPYIRQCVDSILAQTFTDFELILVDDGSPDNCGAICDEYAAQDCRVRVIHQENGGLSAARNAGIDWAISKNDSTWIAFVDSDDYVFDKYLERLYLLATENSTKCSWCSYGILKKNELSIYTGQSYTYILSPNEAYGMSFPEGCKASIVCACFKLYHISLFSDVRFPVGKIHEDRFTTHKLLFQCDKISITTEPLYVYVRSEDSIMRRPWTPKRMDDFEACEEQLAFFLENGYDKAYKKTVKDYLIVLNRQLDLIRTQRQFKKEYFKPIQKRLRKVYKKYKDKVDINIVKNPWFYRYIFPSTAFAVRAVKRILRTLHMLD